MIQEPELRSIFGFEATDLDGVVYRLRQSCSVFGSEKQHKPAIIATCSFPVIFGSGGRGRIWT